MARDGRTLSHEALEELRLRAADLFAADVPVEQIAAGMGMQRSTVFAWKKAWKAGGAQALAAKPIPGRPGTLSDEQCAELKVLLTGHTPADYGFDAALWTRALIADLVDERFGVRFTDTWVGTLMRRLGFSPQRPVYKATQQDPEEIRRWRTEAYPAIRAQAAQAGASIYFGDEAHLRSDFHAGTTWAPVGETPVITASGKRESVNMISAITPRGRIHFTVHEGRCDAQVFIEFCRALLRDDRGKVFLILDNSPIHRAKILKEYVASTNGRLTLFYLPPYSPQLNPDEWVWKNVKADRVGRRAKREPGQLFDMACHALDRLRKSPHIVRGFFGDPQLGYINQV